MKGVIPLILILFSAPILADNCIPPVGEFYSKVGTSKVTIASDKSLKIFDETDKIIYKGVLQNLDHFRRDKGLIYANSIDVKPDSKAQSHICIMVGGKECDFLKVGICRRKLELFGGESPKLDSRYFYKND